MTTARRHDHQAFVDIEGVVAAIRRGGGRVTSARRAVLAALFDAGDPVSADHIMAELATRAVHSDISSIYRILEHLEELGIVAHVHVGHGPGLYALQSTTRLEYLSCERCDRIDAVSSSRLETLRSAVRDAFGYDVRFDHFPMVGVCASCGEDDAPPTFVFDGTVGPQ